MPLTLGELVADPHLGLTLLTSTVPISAPVLWSHVSELADPTPWLEGGELVMTLGLGLPTRPAERDAYVRRLAKRGVVGLAVDTGIVLDEVPPEIIASGERHQLPVLRIPAPTPFIAISRAVVAALTADAIDAMGQVAADQQRVASAALRSGGAGVVRVLSAVLHADVALLDGRGEVIDAAGSHVNRIQGRVLERLGPRLNRRPGSFVHVYADSTLTVQAFVGEGSDPYLLALGSAAPFSAHERLVVAHAVTLLGLLARTPARIAVVEGHLRRAVARSLLVEGGTCEPDLARALGFDQGARVVVVHCSADTDSLAQALADRLIEALPGATLRAQLPDGAAVVSAAGVGLTTTSLEMILASVGPRRGGRVAVGLSRPMPLAAAGPALSQARSASRIAALQGRRVVAYADLAPIDSLLCAQPSEATKALVDTVLGRLISHDAASGTKLVDTVEAFLATNGHAEATSAALGIHRHTLKQRLTRAQSLLGRDLDDATVRANVWLALRARALESSGPLTEEGDDHRAEDPSIVPVT